VLHASTSTNNPVTFFEMFRSSVFPYFSANPAPASLKVGRHGVYVTPDSTSLYVREGSLRYYCLTLSKSTAMALRCAALRLAGKPDVARRLSSGFRAYLLYRSSKLDFGLFYCSARGAALEGALPGGEQRRFALLFRGDWSEYEAHHCRVISAKYFGERRASTGGARGQAASGAPAAAGAAAPAAAAPASAAPAAASSSGGMEAPRADCAAGAPATAFASVAKDVDGSDNEGASATASASTAVQQQMSTILRTISSLGIVAS
jgi:hypothetical protein